jgi:aryl-alcohol dehydrogenase-like predicted oxidoreductase
MEYRQLGGSGLMVSAICLGTMTFAREADETASFRILDRFMDLGGNLIDTADDYSAGASEELLGRWTKGRGCRDRVVLATKVYATTGPGPNDGGLARIHIQRAVEASLRRLQTEVIDLYQIQRWDARCPIEETAEALSDLVRQGKVRYIGCSNLPGWQLSRFLHVIRTNHWTRPISIQPIYSVLNRGIELELLPLCEAEGLGVMAYNPLAGGMLTGKYRRGEPMPCGARLEAFGSYFERYYTEQALDVVERFVQVARERGVTPAQLALAWVLAEPRLTGPIVGARSVEQFADTVAGLQMPLTWEERAAIPAVEPGRWVGRDPVYDRRDELTALSRCTQRGA